MLGMYFIVYSEVSRPPAGITKYGLFERACAADEEEEGTKDWRIDEKDNAVCRCSAWLLTSDLAKALSVCRRLWTAVKELLIRWEIKTQGINRIHGT